MVHRDISTEAITWNAGKFITAAMKWYIGLFKHCSHMVHTDICTAGMNWYRGILDIGTAVIKVNSALTICPIPPVESF